MSDATLAAALSEWMDGEYVREDSMPLLRSILEREGLAVVPVEPSEEMLAAAHWHFTEATRETWRAMIAAAQEPKP